MIRHVPIAPGAGRLDLRGGWRLRSDFDDILVLSLKPGLFGAVRSPRFQIQNNPEHIQRMVMLRPPELDHAAAANIHLQRPAPLETGARRGSAFGRRPCLAPSALSLIHI